MAYYDNSKLIYFHTFLAVAKNASFSKSAEELNISAALATKYIAHLEADLELKLFERNTRSVSLTEAGDFLYKNLPAIMRDLNSILEETKRVNSSTRSNVRLGICNTSDWSTFFYPYFDLPSFKTDYPDLEISLSSDYMDYLVNGLFDQKYDAIVVPDFFINTIEKRGYHWQYWMKTNSIVTMHESNPLASQEEITLKELADMEFIALHCSIDNAYIKDLKNIFANYTYHLNISAEYPDAYTMSTIYHWNKNALLFSDSYANTLYGKNFVRRKVSDHESGMIIIWNPLNKTAIQFVDGYNQDMRRKQINPLFIEK